MDRQRWKKLSLQDQMGHLTSEWTRARHWEIKKDETSRNQALVRALEILDVMVEVAGPVQRREICRLREITAHCLTRSGAYRVEVEHLVVYGSQHLLRKPD